MQTLVSLYLPAWAVELARLREQRSEISRPMHGSLPEAPVLLSRTVAQRELVVARCVRARAAGVCAGMTLAEARALLPPGVEPMVREHSPGRDAAALRRLAHWAVRFTPLVATDPPDGLLLDISKSLRLLGGVEIALRRLVRGVRKFGFTGRAVAAPTFGAAWAAARFAPFEACTRGPHAQAAEPDLFSAVVPRAELIAVHPRAAVLRAVTESHAEAVLSPLPIAALRVEQATIDALEEVGVLTIGQLMKLPRRALPSRFGPLLTLRLQQTLGYQSERIEPVRVVEPVCAGMVFDGPTTDVAAIRRCVCELLDGCAAELRRRAMGARLIQVVLTRSDLDPVVLSITLSRPSDSAAHMWVLLRPKVEAANLGFGIDGIDVRVPRLSRMRDAQPSLPPLQQAGTQSAAAVSAISRETGELVDTLAARLGASRVVRMEPEQSHLPERVFCAREVLECQVEPGARVDSPAGRDVVTASPRPTRLIDPPRAVQVVAMAPDGPVARVRIGGEDVAIVTSIGPERLGEEWWRTRGDAAEGDALRARDYFRVQDAGGRWLWIYRQSPGGRWWLHGEWS